jgi:deoxyribodipyrimidine photo-lyase
MKENIQLIWFKKNLRILDNEVFSKLCSDTATIWFFLLEDEIIKQNDFSYFHLKFTIESLAELKKSLKKLNIELLIIHSSFEKFIIEIEKEYEIKKIISTQETWNFASYKRDLRVTKFLKNENIVFEEVYNNWIVRWLKKRDDWSKIWNQRMKQEIFKVQKFKKIKINNLALKESEELLDKYLNKTKHLKTQIWWENNALKILDTFLNKRVEKYSYDIWKPLESTQSCSRLSPYITYWNISIKYIYLKSIEKIIKLREINDEKSINKVKQINFFLARLHWQSHFIQKLEIMPSIEYKNISKSFDKIRNIVDQEVINDFFNAKTWIPYIDASIICLKNTWWINFRTRAILVSYICNTMMQPWQEISKKLACLFTDYEPWIHYSQIQMQAWTSWINTIRIYNPIKQSKEKDKYWKFIKKWIPELKDLDINIIHEPWLNENKIKWYDKKINIDELNRLARDVIWWIKNGTKNKKDSKNIQEKIWSRKNIKKENIKNQLTIF